MQHTAYLLLGSNLGDSVSILASAKLLIEERIGPCTKFSSIYKTEPWSMQTDDWFYNQVLEIETSQSPESLIQEIYKIEEKLGRKRAPSANGAYQSRTIDIDILYFDEIELNSENLVIPHPRIAERRFVLVPMCEVNARYVHPINKANQKALLDICPDNSIIDRI